MTTTTLTQPATRTIEPSIGHVTAADGTPLGYRQYGDGTRPGLLHVHGSMQSSDSHRELAAALAGAFTVYLPDRRGRGLSGPFPASGYGIQTEVDDLAALIKHTGARRVMGVSAGALVCLQAALTLPQIAQAVIFEPPLSVNGSANTDFLPRFDREIAAGHTSAALVTGMLGAHMGPALFNYLPRPLLEWLTGRMLAGEKPTEPGAVTWGGLAPTLHYDFTLVSQLAERAADFRGVSGQVLLLGGSASPAYLKTALDKLEQVLPHVRRVELPGLGHAATGNAAQRGHPALVAAEVRRFFTQD